MPKVFLNISLNSRITKFLMVKCARMCAQRRVVVNYSGFIEQQRISFRGGVYWAPWAPSIVALVIACSMATSRLEKHKYFHLQRLIGPTGALRNANQCLRKSLVEQTHFS